MKDLGALILTLIALPFIGLLLTTLSVLSLLALPLWYLLYLFSQRRMQRASLSASTQ
jgi:Cu/Ag efflux pump CusA